MNFDIKTEQLGDDAYVISLAGEVDLYTAPEFKQQLLEVIGQGGKQVVVDFSDTTFIDSTTLGVLVGGVKRLRTNDGQLSLVCSDRNITKIFEITGSRPRLHDLPDPRRGRVQREVGRQASRVGLAAPTLSRRRRGGCRRFCCRRAEPAGSVSNAAAADWQNGRQVFHGDVCRVSHARGRRLAPATIGPNLDASFARGTFRGVQGVDDPRHRPRPDQVPGPVSPSGQNNPDYLKANMPANLGHRAGRDRRLRIRRGQRRD